jgi:DNA polymerase I-like protein with 3'-5' exonuclease and polymerase domains
LTSPFPPAPPPPLSQAINTLCQGSAADLIKRAMLDIDRKLVPAEGRALHRAAAGRLLLQVHDELIFEVAAAHAPRLRELVRHAMEGAAALRVPLFVKVQQGPSWGELSEVEASSA